MNRKNFLVLCIIIFVFFNPVNAQAEGDNTIQLDLQKCIQMAIDTHPSILKAQDNIDAAEAVKTQSLSPFYPTVFFNSQYSRTNANSTSFSGGSSIITSQPAHETSQTNFVFKERLFDTFRTWHNYKLSLAQIEQDRYSLETSINNLALQVTQVYFQVVSANHVSELNETLVTQAQKHLDLAQANYQAGISPKSDIFSAEVNVTQAKVNLLQAQNDVKTKKATLKSLIGVGVNSEIMLGEDTIKDQEKQELNDGINSALSVRPELKGADAGLEAQDRTITLLKLDRYPQLIVDLGGNVDLARSPSDTDDSYSLVATLSFPIFDGFNRSAKVEQAEANKAGLEADKLSLEKDISLEVEQAYYALQTAVAKIALTSQQSQEASKNLDIAEGRYQVGVGSLQEVLDAQVSYNTAMNSFITSKYDYQIALAAYKKATGEKLP